MPRPDPLNLVMLSKEIDRLTELYVQAKGAKKQEAKGRLRAAKKRYEAALNGYSNNGERLRSQVQGGWAITEPRSRRFRN